MVTGDGVDWIVELGRFCSGYSRLSPKLSALPEGVEASWLMGSEEERMG